MFNIIGNLSAMPVRISEVTSTFAPNSLSGFVLLFIDIIAHRMGCLMLFSAILFNKLRTEKSTKKDQIWTL